MSQVVISTMDIQTISIIIAAAGVFIAAINQIVSRRRTEAMAQLTLETRQAQLFMQIYNRWNSRDITKSYGALRFKYSMDQWAKYISQLLQHPHDPNIDLDEYADHQMFGTFFEGLGILVKRQLVDITLVEDLFADRIIWYWETQVEPLAAKVRTSFKDSKMYDSIEYLYHEMKKRQQQAPIST